MKGVGEGPVEEILSERSSKGIFDSVFDLMRRLDLRQLNKKVLESLALGGAFDSFSDIHRAQYFEPSEEGKYSSFIEHLLRYGQAHQHERQQSVMSLFGETQEVTIPEPLVPSCEPWPLIATLEKEKEIVGIYISGHPLDDYEKEEEHYANTTIEDLEQKRGEVVKIAAVVQSVQHRVSKKGTGWGNFVLGDRTGSTELSLFSEDYAQHKSLLEPGAVVLVEGKYEERWGREGEFQLRISAVTLMEDVAKKRGKGVVLHVPIHALNADMIDRLHKLCMERRGPHPLRILLIEPQREVTMGFKSRKTVLADTDFLRQVEQMGLQYRMGA